MRTETINRELFDRLAGTGGGDLISIHIPTHRRGRQVAQDRIQLKNQLASASEQLEERGWKPRERSSRLEAAEALLDDRDFWEHQSDGLAVFIDEEGEVTPVSLSTAPAPASLVMPSFALRSVAADLDLPSVPVLALSRGFVGLYRANGGGATRVEADLPGSFDDVNWFVDREKQRQQHPQRAGSTSRHGHEPGLREMEDTRRFLREVADALPGDDDGTTLVVLGEDTLVGRFEDETRRRVISPANSGLSGPVTEAQVFDLARPVVANLALEAAEGARARAGEQLGLGNASGEIETALPDALSGRVDEVVFHGGVEPVWGRIDESTLEVKVASDRSVADIDLLDRLIVSTIRSGGSAHAVDTPIDGMPFVAIRRF